MHIAMVTAGLYIAYTPHQYSTHSIRESVYSLCRDGADMPCPFFQVPNAAVTIPLDTYVLFLKILSCTQQATESKLLWVFPEAIWLQRSSTPPLKAIRTGSHFPVESVHASVWKLS